LQEIQDIKKRAEEEIEELKIAVEEERFRREQAEDTFKEYETRVETLEKENNKLQTIVEEQDGKISKLSEENKQIMLENEELTKILQEGGSIPIPLDPREDPTTDEYFDAMYQKIKVGESKRFDPKDLVKIELSDEKHCEFLENLNRKLPNMDTLRLCELPEENKDVCRLLSESLPEKIRRLDVNLSSEMNRSITNYIDSIEKASLTVRLFLYYHHLELDQSTMIKLLTISKNKRGTGFLECKLDLSTVPNFDGALEGSGVTVIVLDGCFQNPLDKSEPNKEHFENLLEGLSKESDFRNNLREIHVGKNNMKKTYVEEVLNKYEFGRITIYQALD